MWSPPLALTAWCPQSPLPSPHVQLPEVVGLRHAQQLEKYIVSLPVSNILECIRLFKLKQKTFLES